jgi:predicted HicB family RNase H-like nuclease
MTRVTYNGITFRENYDSTFEVFKKEFENTWVFKKFQDKERLAELKKAFKIAIAKPKE